MALYPLLPIPQPLYIADPKLVRCVVELRPFGNTAAKGDAGAGAVFMGCLSNGIYFQRVICRDEMPPPASQFIELARHT